MAHKYPLEPNPNRVYTKDLRKEYNAGLRNTKWVLRTLPFLSVGGALLGHFGTIWIDPLWGAALLLLSEFYLSARFGRLRYRVQDALSNRYHKDFTSSVFVGVSPAEDVDFDGDPCWDVGFLEFGRGVMRFYGDECSFTLLPQEITVKLLDGRSNLVKLEWDAFANMDNAFSLSVRHSPHARIGKARRDLHHALKTFSHQPPTLECDFSLPLPPQYIGGKVVVRLRDPEGALSEDTSLEGKLRVWTRDQLPYLVWNCRCGEVNIRSHKLCKLCKAKQPPMPKQVVSVPPVITPEPRFEI
ncbi:MAG TPA: hypothetical protein VGL56_07700 [Fimbriimonadaceae bacterium]|jgi:hypothetical protein